MTALVSLPRVLLKESRGDLTALSLSLSLYRVVQTGRGGGRGEKGGEGGERGRQGRRWGAEPTPHEKLRLWRACLNPCTAGPDNIKLGKVICDLNKAEGGSKELAA